MVWRAAEGGRAERPAWWLPREAALELAALMAEEAEEAGEAGEAGEKPA